MRKCFLWTGRHSVDGYGVLRIHKKQYLLHRVIWQGINGSIPKGMCILHKCDTPNCFNPNHLFLGTWADNNRDRAKKNRSAIGEKSGRSKLTELAVLGIRDLYKTGNYTTTDLGNKFGVSNHQISMVVRRLSWSHI